MGFDYPNCFFISLLEEFSLCKLSYSHIFELLLAFMDWCFVIVKAIFPVIAHMSKMYERAIDLECLTEIVQTDFCDCIFDTQSR
jgi:hypothetical protein